MSSSSEKLSDKGVLPSLAPGQSVTFAPGLIDENGVGLEINFAVADGDVEAIINNVVSPSTVTFINRGEQAAAPAYYVEHTHSQQLDQLAVGAGASAVPAAATPENAKGTWQLRRDDTQAFPAAGSPAPLALAPGEVTAYGGIGTVIDIDDANDRIVFDACTVERSWRIQVRANATITGAGTLNAALRQDPAAAATLIQDCPITAGGAVTPQIILDAIVTIPAGAAEALRTFDLLVTNDVDSSVGNGAARGILITIAPAT